MAKSPQPLYPVLPRFHAVKTVGGYHRYMSVSQQFKAVGGSATTISTCQEGLADLVTKTIEAPDDLKAKIREVLEGREARNLLAQALLDTYVAGLEVGRGKNR